VSPKRPKDPSSDKSATTPGPTRRKRSCAKAPPKIKPPKVVLAPDQEWSWWMSPSQAGAVVGDTDSALRGKIRLAAGGADEVVFDGIHAKRLRGRWKVRLHRTWVVAEFPRPSGSVE